AEPSAGSQARPPPSLATLDPKFWASRGRHDPQAPVISSGRLLGIIQSCACSDLQQDGPAMTLRTQKPVGFIGVWAEFALMNHSCAPNTAITVVQDRMLVHAGRDLEQGEELTRSYLPTVSMTAPAPQRQAALDEAGWGGWRCSCPRCTLEAAISPDLQELLQEALPRWVESNRREDIHMLAELYEEASLLVNELEEAVTAEPDLSDWERDLLRASAYDCYDMLVLCDEYVN
ncbi:SET domain-containing protein, partial [Haematococcus lacustris]